MSKALAICLLPLALTACAKPRAPVPIPSAVTLLSPVEQLRLDITAAVAVPGVARGVWGVVVRSLDRDERLFDLNPRTLLVPASIAKLVSTASAVEAVGWDYRFETTLRTNGPLLSDGTLSGDVFVVGTGDPTIGGRAGDDLTGWIDALKARGVRRIDGRVIGDDDLVEEPRPSLAWAWDDLGYTSGALFGALNLAENRMTVTVTPAGSAGAQAQISVDASAATRPLVNRVVTGERGSLQLVWPEQRPGETSLTIAGSIPVATSPQRLTVAVGNPTLWFASVFRNRLIASGIAVTGEAFDIDDVSPPPNRIGATVLHTHLSHPLSEIVQPLLKESINLYAEAVMRLNASRTTIPTNDAALEGLRQRLASWGIPPDGQQLVDGSGLSRRDVITADTLVAVLRRMHDPTLASAWMKALPIAGVDGSLQTRMKGTAAEGNVRAKTGTMSNVRSLAGYMTTRDGERLAFAIIVNNFEGTGTQANEAIDAVAVRLAAFTRTKTVEKPAAAPLAN